MSSNFDDKHIKKELFGMFMDNELDISTDDYNELLEELMPLIEDVYFKGYESGKVATLNQLQTLEELVEALDLEEDIDDDEMIDIDSKEFFSAEPE
jgi:hypothetical protein